MANEIRRRYNFISGIIDDNPLSNSATTLNSTELAGLAAIGATEHVALVLDPTGVGNGPEIVWVTAHTGSATSATIVRGREGTTAVSHASTIAWAHVATAADFGTIGDSNDEPSTGGLPFEGEQYVDTTNDEWQIYNGSAWTAFPYGAWTAYTPTFGGTSATLGNGSMTARYQKMGRTVNGWITITRGSTTNFSSDALTLTLPVTAYDPGNIAQTIGMVQILDVGTAWYEGAAYIDHNIDTGNDKLRLIASGNNIINTWPIAWGTGDILYIRFNYEAAS